MSETLDFFNNYLPNKIANNPDLVKSVNNVFRFDIDGAGVWTLDLTGEGSISVGEHGEASCVIKSSQATWEAILEKPTKAVQMVMMGKLKVSNLALATQLQKILA